MLTKEDAVKMFKQCRQNEENVIKYYIINKKIITKIEKKIIKRIEAGFGFIDNPYPYFCSPTCREALKKYFENKGYTVTRDFFKNNVDRIRWNKTVFKEINRAADWEE